MYKIQTRPQEMVLVAGVDPCRGETFNQRVSMERDRRLMGANGRRLGGSRFLSSHPMARAAIQNSRAGGPVVGSVIWDQGSNLYRSNEFSRFRWALTGLRKPGPAQLLTNISGRCPCPTPRPTIPGKQWYRSKCREPAWPFVKI